MELPTFRLFSHCHTLDINIEPKTLQNLVVAENYFPIQLIKKKLQNVLEKPLLIIFGERIFRHKRGAVGSHKLIKCLCGHT